MIVNLYLTNKHSDVNLKAFNIFTLMMKYSQSHFQHKKNSLLINVALNEAFIIECDTQLRHR